MPIPLLQDFMEGPKKAENLAENPTSNGDSESGIFHFSVGGFYA